MEITPTILHYTPGVRGLRKAPAMHALMWAEPFVLTSHLWLVNEALTENNLATENFLSYWDNNRKLQSKEFLSRRVCRMYRSKRI